MEPAEPSTEDVLRAVTFLRGLPAEDFTRLARTFSERRLSKGEVLVEEGDPGDKFFVVKTGAVNVFKSSSDGRIQILETLRSRGFLGLIPALDGGPYPAGASAREDATILEIQRAQLLDLIRSRPEIGITLLSSLASRQRRLVEQVAALSLRSVKSRVAAFLLDRAYTHGVRREDGVFFELGVTQDELASRLGTVREIVSRALRALKEESVIRQDRDAVTVVDIHRLAATVAGPQSAPTPPDSR
ncbi:MAG: Crp/Fnr family transcriptional regulator [Planctomycetes bacterium]|nr:Crp/Fnr family transcriptional regulator [Planctomycetota bacterium]